MNGERILMRVAKAGGAELDVDTSRKIRTDHSVRDVRTRRLTGQGREVYHMHVIEGVSQQEVAAAFGITQGRVSQICNAVRESFPQPLLEDILRDEVQQLRALQQPFVAIVLDERQSLSVRAKAHREVIRNKQHTADILGLKTINIRAGLTNGEITTIEFLEEGRKLPDDDPKVIEWMARLHGTPLAIEGQVQE